ncbi:MAG: YfhO family protein [Bifidobacteriaceae bacterium]|nr:YfhO family protein [Bifidobacteriaceae bacterium]
MSFFLPVILMGSYFIFRQMAPFGSSSLLTVDLGQQYVDFFAYLRSTLLHHPSSIFYSFSKDLGGEMWGTNAYYLFSPLNLLLLFFPGKFLTSGIMLILLIRYGLAGLSFAWLLDKTGWQKGPRILAFSTAYAMNGWMIANQLNMIWLDALVILPLIVYGLFKLLHERKPGVYISWLAVMMMDNYYMAWMISIFTFLLLLWELPAVQGWKERGKSTLRYLISSMAAVGIAAVVLLPTAFALTQSKGTYTDTSIKSRFEYDPLKALAKMVPGSFNFDQMSSGQPNYYVGMLMMVGALLYLFRREFKLSQRIISVAITLFFFFSFSYEPLDLFWHAGQFPVWYPSRFSFIFAFWCVMLAAKTLQPDYRMNKWLIGLTLVITAAFFFYVKQLNMSYLSDSQRYIGLAFALITICCLALSRKNAPLFYDLLIVCLAVCDVSTSAFTSLNNIAYVTQTEFKSYTQQLDSASSKIKSDDKGLYRVAKTFGRTKDDPFQGDFNSGDHFGSTLEPMIPNFMGAIGQPAGDGFVTYSNGTQVSDALLGMKYTMSKRNPYSSFMTLTGFRPDWNTNSVTNFTDKILIQKNKNALPFAFGASDKILSLKRTTLDPLNYQSQIMQALAGNTTTSLFTVQNFTSVNFNNVNSATQITGTVFKKRDFMKPASITLTFVPPTNGSYYLTLGPSVKEAADITVNRSSFGQVSNYRDTIVINLAHHQKGKAVKVTFSLKHASAWFQNVSVYKLNQKAFEASVKKLKTSPLHIKHYSSTTIEGTVDIKKGQKILMTTIPAAKGWHAVVDGHEVKKKTVINTFMAIPISTGHHTVKLYYRPPYLIPGLIISLVALALSVGLTYRRRNKYVVPIR